MNFYPVQLSHVWEAVALSNSTHIYVSLDIEVSLVSPISAPTVLHSPELHSIVHSVAHCQDCMVDILRSSLALRAGIHSGLVIPEISHDLEGHAHWSHPGNCLFHALLIVLSNVIASMEDESFSH